MNENQNEKNNQENSNESSFKSSSQESNTQDSSKAVTNSNNNSSSKEKEDKKKQADNNQIEQVYATNKRSTDVLSNDSSYTLDLSNNKAPKDNSDTNNTSNTENNSADHVANKPVSTTNSTEQSSAFNEDVYLQKLYKASHVADVNPNLLNIINTINPIDYYNLTNQQIADMVTDQLTNNENLTITEASGSSNLNQTLQTDTSTRNRTGVNSDIKPTSPSSGGQSNTPQPPQQSPNNQIGANQAGNTNANPYNQQGESGQNSSNGQQNNTSQTNANPYNQQGGSGQNSSNGQQNNTSQTNANPYNQQGGSSQNSSNDQQDNTSQVNANPYNQQGGSSQNNSNGQQDNTSQTNGNPYNQQGKSVQNSNNSYSQDNSNNQSNSSDNQEISNRTGVNSNIKSSSTSDNTNQNNQSSQNQGNQQSGQNQGKQGQGNQSGQNQGNQNHGNQSGQNQGNQNQGNQSGQNQGNQNQGNQSGQNQGNQNQGGQTQDNQTQGNQTQSNTNGMTLIPPRICEARDYMNAHVGLGVSFDITLRELYVFSTEINVYVVNGLVDSALITEILEELIGINDNEPPTTNVFPLIRNRLVNSSVELYDTMDSLVEKLLSGQMVIMVHGYTEAFVIDVRSYPTRTPMEPETEKVIRGSRDGFVENIVINTALTRRRIRDERLRFEIMSVGERSKTDVSIAYIEGIANPTTINEIRNKLQSIHIDGIPMSDKTVEEFMLKQRFDPYPLVRYTERPDVAADHLLEGHILIYVDTSPSVMITPTTFFHHLQHAEEYRQAPAVGTYERWMVFIGVWASLFLQPIWFLFVSADYLLPENLKFIGEHDSISIPTIVQIFIAEFGISLLRMASIHTPSALSSAMSLVAAILVGQLAIDAGLFVEEVIIYVAIATIGTYATPSYELSIANKIAHYIFLFAVAFFGPEGFIISITLFFGWLSAKRVFHTPYLWPFIPFYPKAFLNILIRHRVPNKKLRPAITYSYDRVRESNDKQK